jgi:AcrR family transcriptional regulator
VEYTGTGAKLTKRGMETRDHLLSVAVDVLSSGGPEAVSVNLIAKAAGVTWGTVQHQFGDADGMWAAVVHRMRDAALRTLPDGPPRGTSSVRRRLAAIVESLWTGYQTPIARAVENIRVTLPRDPAVLARDFPRTLAALRLFEGDWNVMFDRLCEGISTSPAKIRRIRTLIPGAVLGLYYMQTQMITVTDAEAAKHCLIDSLVAYLEA